MPPKRKSARTGGGTTGQQSTLSFHNSKTQGSSKITKPGSGAKDVKTAGKKVAAIEQEEVRSAHEVPVEGQEKVQIIVPQTGQDQDQKVVKKLEVDGVEAEIVSIPPKAEEKTARELEAERLADSAIKKYWKMEEEKRIAPRVHQQNLSTSEKILRHFDLSSQYGPCIGISRMKRWKRAEGLGLHPPVEVLAVLLKEEEAEKKKEDSEARWKRAYLDELMEGRTRIVE